MNAIALNHPHQGSRSSFFQGVLSLFSAFQLQAPRTAARAVAQPTSVAHRYGPPRPIYGPKAFTPVQTETPQLVVQTVVETQPCADKWPALRPIYGAQAQRNPQARDEVYGQLRPIFGSPSAKAHRAEAKPAESDFNLWFSFEEEAPEVLTEETYVPPLRLELLSHKRQPYAS